MLAKFVTTQTRNWQRSDLESEDASRVKMRSAPCFWHVVKSQDAYVGTPQKRRRLSQKMGMEFTTNDCLLKVVREVCISQIKERLRLRSDSRCPDGGQGFVEVEEQIHGRIREMLDNRAIFVDGLWPIPKKDLETLKRLESTPKVSTNSSPRF